MPHGRRPPGRELGFRNIDVAQQYEELRDLIAERRPDAVVHFAEQRAAPYSMKSPRHKRYTVDNNVNATSNLLTALVETEVDAHVVHLGTMGVYGYGGGAMIPEGYLTVRMDGSDGGELEREILFPPSPGSVYHLTKTLDQLMLAFFNKNDGVRVTDLHQGIVWGTQTEQTRLDDRLINRFDYDGDYGTVLNRFLMQAAIGYPLTVHGTGGQTRAFIHIQDSVRCIQLAVENPPEDNERVRIFNQMTEVHRVIDLAGLVARLTGAEVDLVDNPRKEAAENDLAVENRGLLDARARPDPPRGRAAAGGDGDRRPLPRPVRHDEDPLQLPLGPAHPDDGVDGSVAARRPRRRRHPGPRRGRQHRRRPRGDRARGLRAPGRGRRGRRRQHRRHGRDRPRRRAPRSSRTRPTRARARRSAPATRWPASAARATSSRSTPTGSGTRPTCRPCSRPSWRARPTSSSARACSAAPRPTTASATSA